jgi:hypothetical protein
MNFRLDSCPSREEWGNEWCCPYSGFLSQLQGFLCLSGTAYYGLFTTEAKRSLLRDTYQATDVKCLDLAA